MLKVKPVSRIIFLISICAVFAVCFAIFATQPKPIQSDEKRQSPDFTGIRVKYLKYLTDALENSDSGTRSAGVELLGAIRDSSVPELIRKYLQDKSKIVVVETARALARHGDKSGVQVLIKILNDKPKEGALKPYEKARWITANLIRAKAAQYLGEIGDKRALEPLKKAAGEDEGRVKDSALLALVKLGDRQQIQIFIEGLDSGFESGMEKSCEVLGDLRENSVKPRLRELMKSWNKGLKRAAVTALGKIGDNESAGVIRALLSDKDAVVRSAAAEALGGLKDLDSLEALKNALSDTNGFVRLDAAEALIKLGDDSGERFIESSLNALDTDARLKSVRILAGRGGKNNISAVEAAFENETNKQIKMEMAAAVVRIIDRDE